MQSLCKCCLLVPGPLNDLGLCEECAICLHCEKEPSINSLGLCQKCYSMNRIRILYKRTRAWTPEWEQHLRCLTRIHQQEMKRLYQGKDDEPESEEPERDPQGQLHSHISELSLVGTVAES